jgi:transaldolase/glucose-6-phosphate isomerase
MPLAGTGISMKDVTDKLLAQGVQLFSDAFDKLLSAVGQQGKDIGSGKINRQTYKRCPTPRRGTEGLVR